MGKEADALATQAAPSFEDITIDYYKPFLAFAEANKWVEGKAEKKFGFNDVVTVKEFTAMLLRALGHDTMGENYAKVMDLAKEQGLFQGVMAEEAAPVIRGVAFIMMNNTLETAPKGEKQALVYKLGYKEMPKPENFAVVEAMNVGLKAIDVKFSKEVDENSLKNIVVKNEKKSVLGYNPVLIDNMTARLVLDTTAKQDAKYTLIVESVKSQSREMVEKFETTIYMSDAVRPEILSVEVINPKTLLVKASEPMDFIFSAVRRLPEFKIEGKSLNGKGVGVGKNEFMVELNTALKPGDYKLEVSGVKDYAGFIAKTAEFDITVVEDKDAPMVVEAKMLTREKIKVVFNEGVHKNGQFKVDGNPVASVKRSDDNKEFEIMLAPTKPLGIGAIVEVKVEYKDQKDIMGNMVKDWAKFSFKVEDDSTLPEVKEISVKGDKITISFTKAMLTKEGAITILKGGKVFLKETKVTSGIVEWNDDENELTITVAKLSNQSAADYVVVLDGFKDSTVRTNGMPKTELPLTGKDTEQPEVAANYRKFKKDANDYLEVRVFFTEEMDEETLLDAKNYTFGAYVKDGKTKNDVRADFAEVSLKSDEGGKVLIITGTDKKVTALGDITIVGLKDKAGNFIKKNDSTGKLTIVTERTTPVQKVEKAELRRHEDGKLQVMIEVKDQIPAFEEGSGEIVLKTNDESASFALTLENQIQQRYFYFDIERDSNGDEQVTNEAQSTTGSKELKVVVLPTAKSESILGDELGKVTVKEIAVVDKVAPQLTKDAKEGKIKVNEVDRMSIGSLANAIFDEKISNAAGTFTIKIDGPNGFVDYAVVQTDGYTIKTNKVMPNGDYTATVEQVTDKAKNALKGVTFNFEVAGISASKVETEVAAGKITKVYLTFDENITVDGAATATVTIDSTGATVGALNKKAENVLEINLSANNDFNDGKNLTVVLEDGKVKIGEKPVLLTSVTPLKAVKAKIVKIVSANSTATSDGKIIVEFDREIEGSAIAGIEVASNGTPVLNYDKVQTNGKNLEISNNAGNQISLVVGQKLTVELKDTHTIKDKQYDVVVDNQKSPEFEIK